MNLTGIPKWAWAVLGGLLAFLALYLIIDAYGDRRFRDGVEQTDAKWKKASDILIAKAQAGATEADRKAAARAADHAAKVEEERKRLGQAEAEGTSPLDILFGRQQ